MTFLALMKPLSGVSDGRRMMSPLEEIEVEGRGEKANKIESRRRVSLIGFKRTGEKIAFNSLCPARIKQRVEHKQGYQRDIPRKKSSSHPAMTIDSTTLTPLLHGRLSFRPRLNMQNLCAESNPRNKETKY